MEQGSLSARHRALYRRIRTLAQRVDLDPPDLSATTHEDALLLNELETIAALLDRLVPAPDPEPVPARTGRR